MCKLEHNKGIANEKKNNGGRPRKYPYQDMAVGDSFTIAHKTVADISGSINHANKTLHPKNYKAGLYSKTGKRIMKGGAPAVRVVRIA